MYRHGARLQKMTVTPVAVPPAVLGLLFLISCSFIKEGAATDGRGVVDWELATLNQSTRNELTRIGNPQTIKCPYGEAVHFDGKGDALFLDVDPLLKLRQFTVEVIMSPDSKGPAEQRFLQIGEVSGDRMMMETRVTVDAQWYLDAYIRSGDSSRALIDKTKLHSTDTWHHAALVVDNGEMATYVDGKPELGGFVTFSPFTKGATSIGSRLNKVYWFKGAIYKIRITPKRLSPTEFLKY